MAGLKQDVAGLKTDMVEVKTDIAEIKSSQQSMGEMLFEMDRYMREELTTKQEHRQLKARVDRLQGVAA